MILGIGTDLCDVRRIERTLARHGDRFVNRIFTPVERRLAEQRAHPAATYAKRFAAKEACAKALGTGFATGCSFEIWGSSICRPDGRPWS